MNMFVGCDLPQVIADELFLGHRVLYVHHASSKSTIPQRVSQKIVGREGRFVTVEEMRNLVMCSFSIVDSQRGKRFDTLVINNGDSAQAMRTYNTYVCACKNVLLFTKGALV